MLSKYTDFADIFSSKLAAKLLEYGINNYAIDLVDDWQPSYGSIYSLWPVELEIFKVYIKNNLANSFIRPFKFFARAPIFFNKKPNGSLRLCMDYWNFNNLTIKKWYLLSLVRELLDQLDRAWDFTHLDLTNAYYWMRIEESDECKIAFRTRYGHFKY